MSPARHAYHLPAGLARTDARAYRVRLGSGDTLSAPPAAAAALEIELPELTTEDLAAICDHLIEAAQPLARMSVADRVAAIGDVAAAWRNPASPWRRLALETLPLVTGYPTLALAAALDNLWGALNATDLAAVVHAELGTVSPRTSVIGAREVSAPVATHRCVEAGSPRDTTRLAVHVLAGNIPGAGVFGMIAALLAGVPSLVKTAHRELFLPALVARSLAAGDARLGAALAVTHWPGGITPLDGLAVARADIVLAYGRDATLANIASHGPRRLLRFGPRASAGLVAREACDRVTAVNTAHQVALFDQQGCLSPQLIVIEEADTATTDRFAQALANELSRLAISLPRAPLTLAESSTVWRFVEQQRWREQEGAPVRVLGDPGGRFSVVCDRSGTPPASPLNRHIVLVPVPALAAASTVLERLAGAVEAIGYAGPEHRVAEAAALAAGCGAHRLCPLERMQAPPFAWRQSGHARLASFLHLGGADAGETTGGETQHRRGHA
jgi:hypothetical protein